MCRFCATATVVERDRIRPRNHDARESETLQVGKRSAQQRAAEAPASHRLRNAGRPEKSEAPVIHVVCGEARDRVILFRDEQRRSLAIERLRSFELPEASEFTLDEREDALLLRVRRAAATSW